MTDAALQAPNELEEDAAAVEAEEGLRAEGRRDSAPRLRSLGPRPSMSVSTAISRVTGFIRIWAHGRRARRHVPGEPYVVANNIPNMIYELVAGGILSAVFIPIFMERRAKHGEDDARDFASSTFLPGDDRARRWSRSSGPSGRSRSCLPRYAPGSARTAAAAIYMFRFFAIQMLIYGAGAIVTGILNSHRSLPRARDRPDLQQPRRHRDVLRLRPDRRDRRTSPWP